MKLAFVAMGIVFAVIAGREAVEAEASTKAFDCYAYAAGQAARGIGMNEKAELRECLEATVTGPFPSLESAESAAVALEPTCPGPVGPYLVALGGSGARFSAPYLVFCPPAE